MLSYYPSSTCIILHHSSYRVLLSDIGLALVLQKRLEIGQVNLFRFSAPLSLAHAKLREPQFYFLFQQKSSNKYG